MKARQLIVGGIISSLFLLKSIPTYADYTVAYVYPEVLIVRAAPSVTAKEIDRVYEGQEVEVVEKCGDWAKVCITLDSYGYINAYHFAYKTYYTDDYEVVDEVTEDYDYDYDYNLSSCDYSYEEYDYSYEDNYDYSYEDYNYDYEDYSYDSYDYTSSYEDSVDYSYSEDATYEYVPEAEVTSNGGGQSIVDSAKQYIGNPYVYGGESLETGADCSGFTKAVLESNGYSVNGRTAAEQAAGGTKVGLDEAQAGDLIYYDNGAGVYHIAIYNGDGTVTHSSNSTTGVTISDMNYSGNAAGAVRYW